jgi:hypothetical protein
MTELHLWTQDRATLKQRALYLSYRLTFQWWIQSSSNSFWCNLTPFGWNATLNCTVSPNHSFLTTSQHVLMTRSLSGPNLFPGQFKANVCLCLLMPDTLSGHTQLSVLAISEGHVHSLSEMCSMVVTLLWPERKICNITGQETKENANRPAPTDILFSDWCSHFYRMQLPKCLWHKCHSCTAVPSYTLCYCLFTPLSKHITHLWISCKKYLQKNSTNCTNHFTVTFFPHNIYPPTSGFCNICWSISQSISHFHSTNMHFDIYFSPTMYHRKGIRHPTTPTNEQMHHNTVHTLWDLSHYCESINWY